MASSQSDWEKAKKENLPGKNDSLQKNEGLLSGDGEFVHGKLSIFDNGLPEESAIYKILHNTFRTPRNPFLPPPAWDYVQPRKTGQKSRKGPVKPEDEPYFGIISIKEKRFLDLVNQHNKNWRYGIIPSGEQALYEEFLKLAEEISNQEEGFMAGLVAGYMRSTAEWQKGYKKRRKQEAQQPNKEEEARSSTT